MIQLKELFNGCKTIITIIILENKPSKKDLSFQYLHNLNLSVNIYSKLDKTQSICLKVPVSINFPDFVFD